MARKQRKQEDFVKKAFYKGGSEAMKDFILQNLKYPEEAVANKIEGTVHLRYHINQKGIVFKAEALTSHGYGLEQEAIRLVKMLKFEIPKNKRNLKLIFNKTSSIHFRLPTDEVKEAAALPTDEEKIQTQPVQQIAYTIVKNKEQTDEAEEKTLNTYTYTINL